MQWNCNHSVQVNQNCTFHTVLIFSSSCVIGSVVKRIWPKLFTSYMAVYHYVYTCPSSQMLKLKHLLPTYLHFNGSVSGESMFASSMIPPRFSSSVYSADRGFLRAGWICLLSSSQSKHWRKCKALIFTTGMASSFLHLTPHFWQKGCWSVCTSCPISVPFSVFPYRYKNICCMLAAEVDSSVCRVLTCHFQWWKVRSWRITLWSVHLARCWTGAHVSGWLTWRRSTCLSSMKLMLW